MIHYASGQKEGPICIVQLNLEEDVKRRGGHGRQRNINGIESES